MILTIELFPFRLNITVINSAPDDNIDEATIQHVGDIEPSATYPGDTAEMTITLNAYIIVRADIGPGQNKISIQKMRSYLKRMSYEMGEEN